MPKPKPKPSRPKPKRQRSRSSVLFASGLGALATLIVDEPSRARRKKLALALLEIVFSSDERLLKYDERLEKEARARDAAAAKREAAVGLRLAPGLTGKRSPGEGSN